MFVSSQKLWGGGEQLATSLAFGLEERGHSIQWVIPRESEISKRLEARGSAYRTIAGRHPTPAELFRLRRNLREDSIDVLFGNDSHAISWCGGMTLGKSDPPKLVGVKHTVFDIRSAGRYNWLLDRLVCVSRSVRDVCLDAGICAEKLRVIHGGLELSRFDRELERDCACTALNIPREIPLICAVGSLIPCKGYDRLIEAAALLRRKVGDFRLVISGDGVMREELHDQIRRHQMETQIKLLGFLPDPNRWIAAADLFVHPSQSEGLSLVTIAAQLIGTPVAATEVGGLHEVMRCEDTSRPLGWIIASENPGDLSDLLLDALSDRRKAEKLRIEARHSALSRFSLDGMVDGFESVFYETLAGSENERRTRLRGAA
jgi:glycosyltransferase involved in cell wall biosynthesis